MVVLTNADFFRILMNISDAVNVIKVRENIFASNFDNLDESNVNFKAVFYVGSWLLLRRKCLFVAKAEAHFVPFSKHLAISAISCIV